MFKLHRKEDPRRASFERMAAIRNAPPPRFERASITLSHAERAVLDLVEQCEPDPEVAVAVAIQLAKLAHDFHRARGHLNNCIREGSAAKPELRALAEPWIALTAACAALGLEAGAVVKAVKEAKTSGGGSAVFIAVQG